MNAEHTNSDNNSQNNNLENENMQNNLESSSSHSHINKNNDKFHFFIGNIFDDIDQIKLLINLRKKLRNKYKLKYPHWNNKFYTNLIYLGYFDMYTANLYMDSIIKPLLEALSEKIPVLDCNYTGFKVDYDKTFYKISLKINDTNNVLESIVVPYLHNNGILPVFDKKKIIYKPSIDLLYYKHSSKLMDKKDINIQLPTSGFKINHLSLIKGTPVKYRPGTPSIHDQMHIEEIARYNVPLL